MKIPLASAPKWMVVAILIGCLALSHYAVGQMDKASRHCNPAIQPVKQIELEFAWTTHCAIGHLDHWGDESRERMRRVVFWDFAFIPAYSIFIFVMCSLVARANAPTSDRFPGLGAKLAYGQLAAGVLDGIENFGLLQLLEEQPAPLWAPLASSCASIKFLLVIAGLLYVIVGVMRLLLAHQPTSQTHLKL